MESASEQHPFDDLRSLLNELQSQLTPAGRADCAPIIGRIDDWIAAAEIRKSHSASLYHSLVDSLPLHVIRKDRSGRLTFVNGIYCKLMGSEADELLGLTDADLFPPDLAAKYLQDDARVFETGEVFHDIEQNVHEGATRYFEVWKVPVHGVDGSIMEVQAVFADVTERVENRLSLARERDLLRTLINHLPDLVYVKDEESRYVVTNRIHQQFLGASSEEEVRGKTAAHFYDAEAAERFHEEDRKVLSSGEPILNNEQQATGADDRTKWFLCSKVPWRDTVGVIHGIVGVDRDITEQREAEEELRRSNRELDQFVAVVTHDLQAPLRAADGFAQLLQSADEGLSAEDQDHLFELRGCVGRMQKLIDSLRSYARITAQSRPHAPTDCNEALEQAIANLDAIIQSRDAKVTFDTLPTVPGDSVQLMQLFQNLIANAIKYTVEEPPTVQVSANESPQEWVISVQDNGIGIPAEKQQDIFRIFHRVQNSEDEFEGSGIGLSVSKRIVERHGGRIWVESIPNEGSTFFFTIAKDKEAP